MDLEGSTSSSQTSSSTSLSCSGHICSGGSSFSCGRKGQTPNSSSGSSVYCPEKRYGQTPYYSGCVSAQLLHSLPFVSNAQDKRCSPVTTARSLDCLAGPEGRLLAYSNSSCQEAISGVHLLGSGLPISCSSLWSQHRPQNIHKVNEFRCKDSCRQGSSCVCLFRRHPIGIPYSGMLSSRSRSSSENSSRHGLDYQPSEVSSSTSSGFQLARGSLGPTLQHLLSPSGDFPKGTPTSDGLFPVSYHNSSDHYASSRVHKLVCSDRLFLQDTSPSDEVGIEGPSTGLLRHSFSSSLAGSSSCRGTQSRSIYPSSSRISASRPSGNDGCVILRLGHKIPQQGVSRCLCPGAFSSGHISKGTPGSVLGTSPCRREGSLCPHSYGFFHCDECGQERWFPSTSFKPVSPGDMEEGIHVAGSTPVVSHQGVLQREGRPAVSGTSHFDRMVPGSEGLPVAPPGSSIHSSGRSLCDGSQQSVGCLCIPVSGSACLWGGCLQCSVGSLESPIPVSSNSLDFEGFSHAEIYEFSGRLISVQRAFNETLVHQSQEVLRQASLLRSTPAADPQGSFGASGGADSISRLDYLRNFYGTSFSVRIAEMAAMPIRVSSARDYESKWKHFLEFLAIHNIPLGQCSLSDVLNFFVFLFDNRGLLANTVAHYRSALSVPLRLCLNIDLLDPTVSAVIRHMQIQRPSKPFSPPSWNLNKVLTYIEGLPARLQYQESLARAAFLLLLATGWRVSELHACVRLSDFCSINIDNELRIRPHDAFLAKNEPGHARWNHITIKPLFLRPSVRSALCPVLALQNYLALSPSFTGRLFMRSDGKDLSIHQLSTFVCRLILCGDPVARVKVHDIRKFAASLSFIQCMDVKELLKSMAWRSPAAFYRHYLIPASRPVTTVAIPGGLITPASPRNPDADVISSDSDN